MENITNKNSSIMEHLSQTSFESMSNPLFNSNAWAEIGKKAAKKGTPIHGHFELTPKCNLDCKMCYIHLQKNQMNGIKELSLKDWKKILTQAIDAGMIFASLSGGECLISPHFDEIYTYLHSRGIMVTILTNGLCLNKKLPLFKQFPPAYIQVSVYGNSEEQYELVTGQRCYATVNSNIDHAISYGLPIGIAVTTSKYLKNISDIIYLYKQKGISVAINQWLMPPYSSTGRILDDFNLSKEEQVEISKELWQLNENKKPIPHIGTLPKYNTDKHTLPIKGITCAAGRSDFSINWLGAMSMCVALNAPTGYPLIEGFQKAWKKTHRAAIDFHMPAECVECDYKNVCNHCPAQHLVLADPGHCSKEICEETKLMVMAGILKI